MNADSLIFEADSGLWPSSVGAMGPLTARPLRCQACLMHDDLLGHPRGHQKAPFV